MTKDRVGFYSWAGPDTIKMIQLKFFNPKIDSKSILASYDYEYLKKAKEIFGITDFWGMYSWGFANESEKQQRDFLISKIENFKKLGIKLHAYVQGPNIVSKEFKDVDWYCVDNKNRRIAYYTGRQVVCINNPHFVEYKSKIVEEMCQQDFDGIYMDNIQMGQLGIPLYDNNSPFIFAGCACKYCQKKFKSRYSQSIPTDFEKNKELTNLYLDFRVDCTSEFLKKMAEITHSFKKEFGTNSFDPKFDMRYVYGTRLEDLDKIQDYILFENHSLPSKIHNNYYIDQLCTKLTKPVFVVSYKKGIGLDKEFKQKDFNNIYSEDKKDKFYACYKGSEYVTNGKWHNLYLGHLRPLRADKSLKLNIKIENHIQQKAIPFIGKYIKRIVKSYYNPVFRTYMENRVFRKIAAKLASNMLQG